MSAGAVWSHLWRAAVLAAILAVAAITAYLPGLSGDPLGWLWTPVALSGAAAAVGSLLWRRGPSPRPAVALAVGLSLAAGAAIGLSSPPSTAALASALDDVDVPEEARLVDETIGGNVFCFDVCTRVSREYALPPGDRREVAHRMRDALRNAGYELQSSGDPVAFGTRLGDRSLYITGRVDPRRADPSSPANPLSDGRSRSGLTLQLTARSTG